jgi:hypothetical protein
VGWTDEPMVEPWVAHIQRFPFTFFPSSSPSSYSFTTSVKPFVHYTADYSFCESSFLQYIQTQMHYKTDVTKKQNQDPCFHRFIKNSIARRKQSLFVAKDREGDFVVRHRSETNGHKRRSKTQFLLLEYRHPERESPVYFELSPAYMWVDNELLSSSFLWFWTKRGDLAWDDKYCLIIMDHDLIPRVLNHNYYIVLTEDSYRIESVS